MTGYEGATQLNDVNLQKTIQTSVEAWADLIKVGKREEEK